MRIKAGIIAAGCFLSLSAVAGTMGPVQDAEYRPWSVVGSLGYTWWDSVYDGGFVADTDAQLAIGDGQTPLGRFAIARDFGAYKTVRFGAELGVQNGNTVRLGYSEEQLDLLGGMPVQATMKPMLDLLATAAWQPMESVPAFGLVKAGIAYRRLQINDRTSVNDVSEVAFEIQAGLGMHISDRANLSLNYQGVFNGSTSYAVHPIPGTGHISNIPNQNGLLLSLSYTV